MAPLIGFDSSSSLGSMEVSFRLKCDTQTNTEHFFSSFSKHMIRQVQVFGGGWNSYMSIVFPLYTYMWACGTHAWSGACMIWLCNAILFCMYCWISTAVLSYIIQQPTRVEREKERYLVVEYTIRLYTLNHICHTHTWTAPHCTYTTVHPQSLLCIVWAKKWKERIKWREWGRARKEKAKFEKAYANCTT